jgi:hypothetical protein
MTEKNEPPVEMDFYDGDTEPDETDADFDVEETNAKEETSK